MVRSFFFFLFLFSEIGGECEFLLLQLCLEKVHPLEIHLCLKPSQDKWVYDVYVWSFFLQILKYL